jgi:hypothetical protein
MVLTEARDLFLNDRETYCSDKTVKNYRNNLGYFFNFVSDRFQKEPDQITLKENGELYGTFASIDGEQYLFEK